MDSSAISSLAWVDLASVHGAAYNPREISDEQFEALKKSLTDFGCAIPLIVNPANGTLIAGHQRTKAMRALGWTTAPAFYAANVSAGDEMTFNQIHNRTEFMAFCAARCDVNAEADGFVSVEGSRFSFGDLSADAVMQICSLLNLYGNVLSSVICDGIVVAGAAYAKAAALCGLRVNAYVFADAGRLEALKTAFSREYGRFSYGGIERRTYIQGMAQLARSADKRADGRKQQKSVLYETMVAPFLRDNPGLTFLDFGCGKGAYVQKYGGIGVEFYPQNGVGVKVGEADRMVRNFLGHLRAHGLPDFTVCDSVLNSVDSVEAERAVLTCINAFSRTGTVFLSGRAFECEDRAARLTKRAISQPRRSMAFYDDNLFTAIYRRGSWFFQHYHTRESIRAVCAECGLEIVSLHYGNASFQAKCVRARMPSNEDTERAIRFEFSLPLPGGRRYAFADEAVAAWRSAMEAR